MPKLVHRATILLSHYEYSVSEKAIHSTPLPYYNILFLSNNNKRDMAAFRVNRRNAGFTFLVHLVVLSIVYFSLNEHFLFGPNSARQEERKDRHLEHAAETDSRQHGINRGAQDEDAVLMPSKMMKAASSLAYSPKNVTEALERLLDFFPLVEENPRPTKPKPPPQQSRNNAAKGNNAATASSSSSTSFSDLSQLIDEETWQVKAPIDDQLDFVIIGNAKTGTTFLQSSWFKHHPQIHLPSKECHLMPKPDGPARVLHLMHSLRTEEQSPTINANNTTEYRRPIFGYKNPQDINRPNALNHFRDYFPKTRLIVGLRHPVWWFQSFYNFRIRFGEEKMPPPETLIGACSREAIDVCTDNSNFHAGLAGLGLTNRSTSREKQLLSTRIQRRRPATPGLVHNPIFLYEQAQLDVGRDAHVAEALRQDLSAFLGLDSPLPPLTKPYQASTRRKFSICQPRYQALRQELLRNGRAAADWILEFFLDVPTVTVSSRGEFEKLLRQWAHDPCDKEAAVHHNETRGK